MKHDVYGMGHAIMDFLVEVEDEILEQLKLKKGHFNQISVKRLKELLKELEKYPVKRCPGGSVSNAIFGVAMFGGAAIFCGRVGKDEHGDFYESETARHVKSNLKRVEACTGHCLTFISPDGQRTFAVNYGAATHLEKEDLIYEDLQNSKILYIEGFRLEAPASREVCIHAMEFAKRHSKKVAVDLSDPGVVQRMGKRLHELIERFADIVFANEEEAEMFTGKKGKDSLRELASIADIAVVKLGADGSLIQKGNDVFEIPSFKVKPVDTTGAGDMYAAGFLYAYTKGYPLEKCGLLGSYFAGKVVQQVGARLGKINKDEVNQVLRGA